MNRRQFFRALAGAPLAATTAVVGTGSIVQAPPRAYGVGEFGQETFVPVAPGRINPNAAQLVESVIYRTEVMRRRGLIG